jgi:flagellar hook protein FlgE
MSLINSLFSGVSGLRNHQTMMDVVGNNIANVNSIGFKGSRVTFSDAFNQILRYGSNATNISGGTNTFQLGLGSKIGIDRNWTQGTFQRTGITTDLGLQGDGLFILKNGGETFYSRAGAFTFDQDGKLVNPQNGAFVQGKLASSDGVIPPGNHLQDIQIDTKLKLPAVASTKVGWSGNLKSDASLTRSENYVENGNLNSSMSVGDSISDSNTIYDDWGNEYTFDVSYTKTAADTYDMQYQLTDSDGTVVVGPTTKSVVFDANGNISTIDGAAADKINISDSVRGLNFDFDPTAVTQINNSNTLSSIVDEGRTPTTVTGTVSLYDTLGNAHSLTLTFTKTSSNNWYWQASVPASSGTLTPSTAKGSIQFDSDGSVLSMSPGTPTVHFTPTTGAAVQDVVLDFGNHDSFSGITQTSSSSDISALSQDGSPSASISNINIDQYGNIVGVFTNGKSQKLAQILLATFGNNNGLISKGDNMYTVTANAGDPLIGAPGESTKTTIQSGALEQSNVDLSEEFTNMIIAQRGFQANARVVTVSDKILQEITNLVR